MIFSSALFLVLFLPITLICYWISPGRLKNSVALLASLIFYAWGAPRFIPILLLSIIIDYFLIRKLSTLNIPKSRLLLLAFSLISSVSLLFYFKYYNFAAENLGFAMKSIALPIGISFFTFQKISYAVDVYQKKLLPFVKLRDYSLYILFFPQLIAGPIVRYGEIKHQIERLRKRISTDEITAGFFRFVIGLSKKILIADQLSEICDRIYGSAAETLTMGQAWLGAIAYAFQIYFDFSGYTDMALGLALMMGYRLPENFNFPYISRSFTEFWRRWHITLSHWMRDYLYIPLGGKQVTTARLYFNLWVVFVISGIWHGAEWKFIVWGIYNGLFLVLERVFKIKLGLPLTFFFLLIGWVIFRSSSITYASTYIIKLFDYASFSSIFSIPGFVYNRHLAILFLCFLLCFLPASNYIRNRSNNFITKVDCSGSQQLFRSILSLLLFLLCVSEMFNSNLETFIYFRF